MLTFMATKCPYLRKSNWRKFISYGSLKWINKLGK